MARIKICLMPIVPEKEVFAHVTIRNQRGNPVAVATDYYTIYLEAEVDARELDIETLVELREGRAGRIQIDEYWDNDPMRTKTWRIVYGLEVFDLGTMQLEGQQT